jgi:hypothetical protein
VCHKLDALRADCQAVLTGSQQIDPDQFANVLASRLITLLHEAREVDLTQKFLGLLQFDAMRSRQEAVAESHARTFQWVFAPKLNSESSEGPIQIPFSNWLEHGKGLFWIAGKAGSGKSTLMKFICQHAKTWAKLDRWAGTDKLVTASYFFWNAGSELQKSQVGLLRTICFDVFRQCPDLIPSLCGARLQALRDGPHNAYTAGPADQQASVWTLDELSDLIRQLSTQKLVSGGRLIKFCLFVDGLDEFGGEPSDLVRTVRTLSQSPHIKVCASSRPWNIFENAFGADEEKKLVVQDLTNNDILRFTKDLLEQNDSFAHMRTIDTRCDYLIGDVANKAQGVFLWVFLVVRELLKSVENGDSIYDLQRRLDTMPPGLEKYFQHMFNTIEDFYRVQTAQTFMICVRAESQPALLAFSVIQPEDELAARIVNAHPLHPEDVHEMHHQLKRRINARCRDLVEVRRGVHGRVVDFLHRTVRDFLLTPDMTQLLRHRAGPDFDVLETLCKMQLLTARRLPYLLSRGADRSFQLRAELMQLVEYARHMELFEHRTPADVLDHVEAVCFEVGVELGRVIYPSNAADGCIPFFIEQDLFLYLQHLVDKDSQVFLRNWTRPLIGEALIRVSNPKVISLLLANGVNPNEKQNVLHTVWTQFLYNMHKQSPLPADQIDTYLQITEAMIVGGAEYTEQCPLFDTYQTMPERRLLSVVFGEVEASRLMRCRDQPALPAEKPWQLIDWLPALPAGRWPSTSKNAQPSPAPQDDGTMRFSNRGLPLRLV